MKHRCDRIWDCESGEDELSCNHGCNGGQWSCRNGDCIAMSRYCDGVADCGDGKASFLHIGFGISQIPNLYQIGFFRFSFFKLYRI